MHPFTPAQPQKVAALDELLRRLSELRQQEDIMEAPRPSIWNFPWPRKFHTIDAEKNWQWYTSQEKEIQARAASAQAQASAERPHDHHDHPPALRTMAMTKQLRTTGEASTPSAPPATIIPPLGQRTTAEILRAVIEAGYYSGGGTPHNSSLSSDFMCHALNFAAIYEVITPEEAEQAKAEIKEYIRYLSSYSVSDACTLWFVFLFTPYTKFTVDDCETLCRITYQDWDSRPKYKSEMLRALETWRQASAEKAETEEEPPCED